MALSVTPGSGASVATKVVGSDHQQVMTMGDGTTGQVAAITTAYGIAMDVTRLPALVAGTAVIGKAALAAKVTATGDTEILADAAGNLKVTLGTVLDAANDSIRTVAGGVNANAAFGVSAKIEDTTAANVIAADSGAGVSYYVTDIMVTNGDATVGTLVTIQDSNGTPLVLWQGYAAAVGGGWSKTFATPVKATANCHIHVICGTTNAEVYACVSGFLAA